VSSDASSDTPKAPAPPTIADVLSQARQRIRRYSPEEAAEALERGALLVDTRPQWQRDRDGAFPDAANVLVIERNHLEWRLDPASDARIPQAIDHDVEVVVSCSEGYASSLAAASLVDIGLHEAGDLDGGFLAWKAAGLPIA
jgi:rhodanese-related sulfurtransferase